MVMHSFNFARVPQIYFGAGRFNDLVQITKRFGNNIFIVTGRSSFKSSDKFERLFNSLERESIKHFCISVSGEPSPEVIDNTVREFKNKGIDLVVAIGGGSVLDAGKAISAMLTQDKPVINFLEGIGTEKHHGKKLPFIAVPTTAGTGSEVTKNAVITEVGKNGFKKSLRHDNFVPEVAVVDPELTVSCPSGVTAACGMDAFSQLLEGYISTNSSPLTDALALSGMCNIKDNLVLAYGEGAGDIKVRSAMSYASLVSGIVLANAGLGIIHGLAGPIGGFFNIPHGVICGTLLAPAIEEIVKVLNIKEEKDNQAMKKLIKVGSMLTGIDEGDKEACLEGLVHTLYSWTEQLKLPLLNKYGIMEADIEKIIERSSQKNNPVKLNNKTIERILIKF